MFLYFLRFFFIMNIIIINQSLFHNDYVTMWIHKYVYTLIPFIITKSHLLFFYTLHCLYIFIVANVFSINGIYAYQNLNFMIKNWFHNLKSKKGLSKLKNKISRILKKKIDKVKPYSYKTYIMDLASPIQIFHYCVIKNADNLLTVDYHHIPYTCIIICMWL